MKSKRALLIVDLQNDFCPGGALPVPGGDGITEAVNRLTYAFDKVVATQDWHPAGHASFASSHGKKPYETARLGGAEQTLWPDHCVAGTRGADFHPGLDTKKISLVIRKGMNPDVDSYSAFLENDRKTETGLRHYLKGLGIREVFICGLATDYCVYFSALDAKSSGFATGVIVDACRGVGVPEGSIDRALDGMKKKGILAVKENSMQNSGDWK